MAAPSSLLLLLQSAERSQLPELTASGNISSRRIASGQACGGKGRRRRSPSVWSLLSGAKCSYPLMAAGETVDRPKIVAVTCVPPAASRRSYPTQQRQHFRHWREAREVSAVLQSAACCRRQTEQQLVGKLPLPMLLSAPAATVDSRPRS